MKQTIPPHENDREWRVWRWRGQHNGVFMCGQNSGRTSGQGHSFKEAATGQEASMAILILVKPYGSRSLGVGYSTEYARWGWHPRRVGLQSCVCMEMTPPAVLGAWPGGAPSPALRRNPRIMPQKVPNAGSGVAKHTMPAVSLGQSWGGIFLTQSACSKRLKSVRPDWLMRLGGRHQSQRQLPSAGKNLYIVHRIVPRL